MPTLIQNHVMRVGIAVGPSLDLRAGAFPSFL